MTLVTPVNGTANRVFVQTVDGTEDIYAQGLPGGSRHRDLDPPQRQGWVLLTNKTNPHPRPRPCPTSSSGPP